jgi:hypothetical protein
MAQERRVRFHVCERYLVNGELVVDSEGNASDLILPLSDRTSVMLVGPPSRILSRRYSTVAPNSLTVRHGLAPVQTADAILQLRRFR